MNIRLDEAALTIYTWLGPIGLVAAVGLLLYCVFGPFTRALGLAMLLLVAAQSWFTPAYFLGRNLRWWALLIVCTRGVLLALRTPRPAWDSGHGRTLAAALGGVAVGSCLWAQDPLYSIGTAASFVISLVASFVVLWRLYDIEDVVASASRGALWCALLVFGGSFAWLGVALFTGQSRVLWEMGWGMRFSAVFFNANMVGILAMVLIPALVAAPREWLGRGATFRWPAFVMCAAALYLSGSRASILGTVVALTILFLYRFGAGALLTVALGAVGIYVLVTSSTVEEIDKSAIGHISRTKHINTLSGRLELWEEGLDAVRGREAIGLGWGRSRLLHGADPDAALESGHVAGASNLHSAHVQILVDLGFLGAGILWLLCAQVLWSGWKLLLVPRTERSVTSVMVLSSFVATLADSFVHGSVLSTGSPSALIFWSSAVLILRESDRARAGVVYAPAPDRAAPTELRPALR